MSKVRIYIDGFNIYHAIDPIGDPKLKWLNYWTLSKGFLRNGELLDEVNFLPQFKIMTPKKESVISTIFLHFAQ